MNNNLEKFGFIVNEHNYLHGGEQFKFFFVNGHGASVIKHSFSYGEHKGLWELAVIDNQSNLVYDTDITEDVIGYLNDVEVNELLIDIKRLDKYGRLSY